MRVCIIVNKKNKSAIGMGIIWTNLMGMAALEPGSSIIENIISHFRLEVYRYRGHW